MEFEFTADVVEWRGPAPYWFAALPDHACAAIDDVARAVTYGWGMVPVTATIGGTTWTTSMWPRNGGYLLPLRDAVRRAERLESAASVIVTLRIDLGRRR